VTVRIGRLAALVGLIVCTLGLAAAERPESKTHTVTIEGMRFQPERLTVARGDTVVWLNKDLVPHTATSKEGGFDSKTIEAEQSWKFTAGEQGEFAYLCTFHPTMAATLRVR
jgi:plastocyanin